MSDQKDCIFCKIIAGEIPSEKIYEDDKVLVFLDIKPANHGHTLVIPKKHSDNILEMSDEDLSYMAVAVKKISLIVKETTSADGFNVGVNTGACAGQTVFHAHWHVIPRFDTDTLNPWPRKEYAEGEREVMGEELRTSLKEHLKDSKLI